MACLYPGSPQDAVTAQGPSFAFYQDAYRGTLDAASFAEATPSALRCVRELCGGAGPSGLDEDALMAWGRTCCAAAEAFAEFGEGRVGGYTIKEFKVTNYMEKGTTGLEIAQQAA
jgi:hypothetical protein